MPALAFVAYGMASPAGSKRAFTNRHTGRTQVVDAAKGSKAWKQEVATEAYAALALANGDGLPGLIDGPLAVSMTFFVPRPSSHYGARGLKPSAPDYPTTRPDVLKLARAVEDALTGVVYRDDAQLVRERLAKLYGEPARVEVEVEPL